jgi:hypothetical protein
LASLPTLDETGVAVRQTGGRDPHHRIQIPRVLAEGSQPAGAGSRAPPAAPSPLDKGKGAASSSSAPGGTGGWRKRGDAGYVAPTGRLFWILLLIWTPPQKRRGPLAGPRRPAPRPRARRGTPVLRHPHHQIRHHHRSRRRHHHLGVISPRCTNGSNNNSSNNNSGRPASRVAGRSRAPSKCSPFFPRVQLLCLRVLTHPLLVRASSPSASKVAPPPSDTMPAGGSSSQQQASARSGAGEPPTATAASTMVTPSSTPSAATEEVPTAPTPVV